MGRYYDIGIAIRNRLRSNVSDPLGRSTSWIHYDEPINIAKIGKTPAVFINRRTSSIHFTPVGGHGNYLLDFSIIVIVGTGDKGKSPLSGSAADNSNQLLDDITQDCIAETLLTVHNNITEVYKGNLGGKTFLNENTMMTTSIMFVQEKE